MFIVLEIDNNYGEILDIRCVKTCSTEQEALQFMQEQEALFTTSYKLRDEYITNFANDFLKKYPVPPPNFGENYSKDRQTWQEYIDGIFYQNFYNVNPENILFRLKEYLDKDRHMYNCKPVLKKELKNFHPPELLPHKLLHYVQMPSGVIQL